MYILENIQLFFIEFLEEYWNITIYNIINNVVKQKMYIYEIVIS